MVDINTAYPQGRIIIREVGLRDGLQLTKSYPSTHAKRDWIAKEYNAGLRHFEVGSFLPVSHAPQFGDVREVINEVNLHKGAHGIALALNERGATDALATDVQEITLVISASQKHNEANSRRSQEQSLKEIANTIALKKQSDKKSLINVGVAMAFGCPLQGEVSEDDVMRIVDQCFDLGADMVGIADTIGFAGPKQIESLCTKLYENIGMAPYVLHLHDTRGMGIANASAALNAGCRIFDASLAGLGGCPFAPGATGNVVLEDLIYLVETMGFDTKIAIEDIIATRSILSQEMPDEILFGALAKSGVPETFNWKVGS